MKTRILKISMLMGVFSIFILGFTQKAEALAVRNTGDGWKTMSASTWGGRDGSHSWYTIKSGDWEYWNREDERGTLLVYNRVYPPMTQTYFLKSDLSTYIQDDHILRTRFGVDIAPINTNVPSGTNNKINVKNNSNYTVRVAISRWNNSNDGSFYNIKSGATEEFTRDDMRGYIMNIGNSRSYYVKPGKDITIDKNGNPSIDGKEIEQIYKVN